MRSHECTPRPVHVRVARSLLVTAAALMAALAGCAGANTGLDASDVVDSAAPVDSAPTPPSLAGAWRSDCLPSQSNQSITLAFDMTATTWTLDYVTYGDTTCSAPFVTVHVTGPYELSAPSSTVAGAWEARFAFDTKTVTPHGAAAVGYLSSLSGCGGGNWQDGVASDVYATGCPSLGQYPQSMCAQDYDLVSLSGSDLRFGQRPMDNNMCTVDRRPTAVAGFAVHRQM